MGVTGLWDLISTAIERVPLSHMEGKLVAVDLACWIIADRSIAASRIHAKPDTAKKETQNFHVRNLLFRCQKMLQMGIEPVFVLDGKAPDRKLKTIATRLGKSSINSGERRQLTRLFKPCCELFDGMGLHWIQAPFEAEKMCAILQQAAIVDAVLTTDGDAFCFGATKIYRSFSSDNDAELEYVTLEKVKELYNFDRFDFITFALLLGCDFFPAGIKGIGPKMLLKLILNWKARKQHPIHRLIGLKHKNQSAAFKEEEKLVKLLKEYPEVNFNELILEFRSTIESEQVEKIELGTKSMNAEKMAKTMENCLEWDAEKSRNKAIEFKVVTGKQCADLTLDKIVKKVRCGKSFFVQWKFGDTFVESKIKLEQLERVDKAALESFLRSEENPKASKVKKAETNPVDIRKFIQKRKVFSPLQCSNPAPLKTNKTKTPQKLADRISVNIKEPEPDFSLGISLLCDDLENSKIEDSASPTISPVLHREIKPTRLIVENALNSDESSDEEFLSLLEKAKLKKLKK